MLHRLILILPLLCSGVAVGVEVTDSTGRAARIPDQIRHVVPAGPPAAVLFEAMKPDLIIDYREVTLPRSAGFDPSQP